MAEEIASKTFDYSSGELNVIDHPPVYIPDYTICDFIDPRITTEAQEALFEHLRQGEKERWEALHLWAAVKHNLLEGIFIQDQRKPALKAQRHGSAWWTMIPKGQDAVVFPPAVEESTEIPLLAFHKRLVGDKRAIARALVQSWMKSEPSKIPVTIPYPSGRPCGSKPPKGDVIVGPISIGTPQPPDIPDFPCPSTASELAGRFEIYWNSCSISAAAIYFICGRWKLQKAGRVPVVLYKPSAKACKDLPDRIEDYTEGNVCRAVHAELAIHLGCLVSYRQVLEWYREWMASR